MKDSQEPQDQELSDDLLDQVVGGVQPPWAHGPHPIHGGGAYHGKKDQTSGMDDMTDCDCDISF
jgi:hypothetical protein